MDTVICIDAISCGLRIPLGLYDDLPAAFNMAIEWLSECGLKHVHSHVDNESYQITMLTDDEAIIEITFVKLNERRYIV